MTNEFRTVRVVAENYSVQVGSEKIKYGEGGKEIERVSVDTKPVDTKPVEPRSLTSLIAECSLLRAMADDTVAELLATGTLTSEIRRQIRILNTKLCEMEPILNEMRDQLCR